MLTLEELEPRQCRFPITPRPPHYFCGEATDGRSYCPEHDKLCHAGKGKDWQALAGMIDATETTVLHITPREDRGPEALDSVLRDAENYFDEPGGLMRRV